MQFISSWLTVSLIELSEKDSGQVEFHFHLEFKPCCWTEFDSFSPCSYAESGSVDCAIEIDAIRESPDRAFGNGSLIFLCVETSNGYRLGCSAIGHRDKQASDTGT